MSDPINKEIITALRELIRNEVKAALAEFYIEVPNRSSPSPATLQRMQAMYETTADQVIQRLEAMDLG